MTALRDNAVAWPLTRLIKAKMTDAGVRTSGPQRVAPMTTKEQTLSEGEMPVIGQGAEAEVFERQDGRVLKLLRARGPVERVAYEVAALDAARSAGLQVTRVLLTTGEPPPGTPLLLGSLAKVARRLLVSSYTRSYERHAARPVDRARVRDWEIVNVAVRLFENVPGERPRLLRRLRKEIARRDATSKRRHT